MEFSGLYFLFGLFPLIALVYFLLPVGVYKNYFLIGVSLLLYALVQPLYVPLLLMMCRVNFSLGQKIRKDRVLTLIAPAAVNLAVLFLLRYLDPVLLLAGIGTETNGLLVGLVGMAVKLLNSWGMALQVPTSVAPFGFAFFTLNSLSYLIDIYSGRQKPERKYSRFLLHMLLFVRLFQGPLVRYSQTVNQLGERREIFGLMLDGMVRFCTGLGKKVLLADYCGRMIAELVENGSHHALVGSWLTAALFLFRVYYDFSGCCDMAIGLGRIFGFRLPENFNLPYMALSVKDFLTRWNLTLVGFFRDYVYCPLVAKRPGTGGRYFAMLLCAVLGGIWHGGSLNFLIWGVYLFAFVMFEEIFEGYLIDLPDWLRRIMTVLVLLFGWVIFMNPEVDSLVQACKAMIGYGGALANGDGSRVLNVIPLMTACWIGVTDLPRQFRFRWRNACGLVRKDGQTKQTSVQAYAYLAGCVVYILIVLWWVTVSRTGAAALPSVFGNL